MRIVALVPMRHSSERVPGKNYRDFCGKPLFHYVVSSLLACPSIDQVVIDTDSPTIRDDAAQSFPEVRVQERPEHLRAGEIAMNDVLLNAIEQVPAEYYLQTHSTNPLLRPETVEAAISHFLDSQPAFDSLFSVTRLQTRLWDQLTRPLNHNPAILLRTQDLPPVYEENSCMFLFSREVLQRYRNRIGQRPAMYPIERYEATDIDVELDFRYAEFLYRTMRGDEA